MPENIPPSPPNIYSLLDTHSQNLSFFPCPRMHGKCWGLLHLDCCFGEKLPSSARLYFDLLLSKSHPLRALSIFVPLNSCMSGALWSLLKTYCYIPFPDFKNLFPIRLTFIYTLRCPIPIFTSMLRMNNTTEKQHIFCPALRSFICYNNNLPIRKQGVFYPCMKTEKEYSLSSEKYNEIIFLFIYKLDLSC